MKVDDQAVTLAAKAAWDAQPEIRAEFGSLESFAAYERASARGACRVISGGVVTGNPARDSLQATALAMTANPPSVQSASLQLASRLELLASGAGAALPSQFSGVAYSGGVVRDFNAVIDLATTKFSARMPILADHNRSLIVGVADKNSIANARLMVGGKLFSDMVGSQAERIAMLAQRGAPYELSVGIYGYTVDRVAKGKSVAVNGQTFEGPIDVIRDGHVREVSIVTLGADPNTNTKFFHQRA